LFGMFAYRYTPTGNIKLHIVTDIKEEINRRDGVLYYSFKRLDWSPWECTGRQTCQTTPSCTNKSSWHRPT